MIYKFDTIDVIAYGVLPLRGDGGVAVSGLFDFPKRKGEIERNWGDGWNLILTGRTWNMTGGRSG